MLGSLARGVSTGGLHYTKSRHLNLTNLCTHSCTTSEVLGFMCACACVYIYIYIYIHTHIHLLHSYMYVYVCVYHIYIYIYMRHLCIDICSFSSMCFVTVYVITEAHIALLSFFSGVVGFPRHPGLSASFASGGGLAPREAFGWGFGGFTG